MTRRILATVLLAASMGGVTAALLPAPAAYADLICIGSDNQRRPGTMTGACITDPSDTAIKDPLHL